MKKILFVTLLLTMPGALAHETPTGTGEAAEPVNFDSKNIEAENYVRYYDSTFRPRHGRSHTDYEFHQEKLRLLLVHFNRLEVKLDYLNEQLSRLEKKSLQD